MEKVSDKKRVFINSIIVTLATISEKLFFFIIMIIVARYLNIDNYGEYSTAIGYATFFSVFTDLGISAGLIRAINLEKDLEREHFANTLFLKTILAVSVYVIMVLSLMFTNYNSDTIHLILIFGLVRFGNQYMATMYAFYDAREMFGVTSSIVFSFGLSFLAGTILVIFLKGNYFHFAYLRLIIVILVLAVLFLITFKKYKFKLKFDRTTTKGFIKNVIPFGLSSICSNFIQRINIIILSIMHGTVYSGIFNNGYIFFLTLSFIPTNFHRILTPYLYKVPFEEDKNKFQFAFDFFTKVYGVISFFLALIIFLFSEPIITNFFGEKYTASIGVLRIIAFGIPFLFNVAFVIIRSLDKQEYNSIFMVIATVVNIISNLILIYYYKSIGAAITTVITFMVLFILCHLYLGKHKYVSLRKALFIYLSLILIFLICTSVESYFLKDLLWIYSIILISFLYFILIIAFLIRSNDIRIVKEIIRGTRT